MVLVIVRSAFPIVMLALELRFGVKHCEAVVNTTLHCSLGI